MVSVNFDISLLIQLINFLALMLALNFFLYKPIRKILTERRDLFNSLKEKAARARGEIEAGEAEKARLNAESLRLGMDKKNALRGQGQAREREILAQAQEQALKDIEAARLQLKEEAAAARTALARETRVIAWDIASKILGRSL